MAEEKKKLQRSNDNRVLAGVCGGLGDYFNVDPTIIRILFVLLAIFVGGGFLVYIILWIVMPQAPADGSGIDISDSEEPAEEALSDEESSDDEAPADETSEAEMPEDDM